MFGRLLRDFEEDQFFSDPFTAHQEHVRQMMRSFSEPFGRDPFVSITDGKSHGRRGQHGSQVALREDHRASSMSQMPSAPFSSLTPDFKDTFHSFDGVMANMRNRMKDMHKQIEDMANRPSTHSFQSSTIMTYSKTGDEPPKIFQASSQTRKAPGGIKETKKAVRDSESGMEKMAVGHHIEDRAHIVKKLKNNKTGNHEVNQEFINIDECEGPLFDNEWDKKISNFQSFEKKFPLEAPKRQRTHYSTKIRPPEMSRRERSISKMVI